MPRAATPVLAGGRPGMEDGAGTRQVSEFFGGEIMRDSDSV